MNQAHDLSRTAKCGQPKKAPRQPVQRDCKRLMCPHCGSPSMTKTSRRMSVLSVQSIYACNNPECGHTFVAVTEIVRTLSPSSMPNPSVDLPMSRHVRRDVLLHQIKNARTAEHEPLNISEHHSQNGQTDALRARRKALVALPDAPQRPLDRVQKKAPAHAIPVADAITQALFARTSVPASEPREM